MRAFSIVIAISCICAGCSKPESDSMPVQTGPKAGQTGVDREGTGATARGDNPKFESSTEKPAPTIPTPATDRATADVIYPENDAVKRILHSAREMHQRSQFQAALDLVVQALAIDPQSPSALALQHELVELMKRIDHRPNQRAQATAS